MITFKNITGVVNISNLRHNSDASNKKPHKPSGTTVKPEECISESKHLKSQKTFPDCETGAPCPTQEKCKPNNKQIQPNKKGSDFRKNGKYQFSYWHLVAALIMTGVAYKVLQCMIIFI